MREISDGVTLYASGALTTTWGVARSELWDDILDWIGQSNGLLLSGARDGHGGYLSPRSQSQMERDVKSVFDPHNRFAD